MKILDYIINNQSITRSSIDILNPYNNDTICSVNTYDTTDVTKVIDIASNAFKYWSQTDMQYRSDLLCKWYQSILNNINELAYIITLENGKTLKHAMQEVNYAASFVKWFAHSLYNIQGHIKYNGWYEKKMVTEFEPIGVVGAITPWNFPIAMVTKKISPAIAAGCTVVLKPSEITPLSSLALLKLANCVGIPDGVFNVVIGDPLLIGQILCKDLRIRKLTFTGSTAVGKLLYHNCAATLKKISLELGGNAPYIVFKDSNVEKAIDDLIKSKFFSSGQSCTAPNRIFVEKDIYDTFIHSFYKKFSTLKTGSGLDKKTDYGPLINIKAVNKILDLITDAQNKGAKVLCGASNKGNLLSATVLKDCNEHMDIFKTEIFGPVATFYSFSNENEVVERANNTEYGLQAYIYSNNHQVTTRVSTKLDFAIVTINDAFPSNCRATFSGRKASGFGFEGGDEGIFEYLNTKYINNNTLENIYA